MLLLCASDLGPAALPWLRLLPLLPSTLNPSALGPFGPMAANVQSYKLVLLGDSAVGKSCLVVRFCRGEFYDCAWEEGLRSGAGLSCCRHCSNSHSCSLHTHTPRAPPADQEPTIGAAFLTQTVQFGAGADATTVRFEVRVRDSCTLSPLPLLPALTHAPLSLTTATGTLLLPPAGHLASTYPSPLSSCGTLLARSATAPWRPCTTAALLLQWWCMTSPTPPPLRAPRAG